MPVVTLETYYKRGGERRRRLELERATADGKLSGALEKVLNRSKLLGADAPR